MNDSDVPAADADAARSSWTLVLWASLAALLALVTATVGIEAAMHFSGQAIDGPFQLYDALRRIDLGQRGGVDFQYFHGLGIPYLHHVLLWLTGADGFLRAEVVRQLTASVVFPLTTIVFLRVFIRDWSRALAWSAIVMAATIALRLFSVVWAVNSSMGLRSMLPTLLPIVLLVNARPIVRGALTGLALGLALLMSTEQGLSCALALIIAFGVVTLRSRGVVRRERAVELVVVLATAIVTLVGLLVCIGGIAGARGALNYNFRLVPGDQYWYFGVLPHFFVASLPDLVRGMARTPGAAILLVAGVVVAAANLRRLWRDPHGDRGRRQLALTVLALYGIISCTSLLGMWVAPSVDPLGRALLLLGAVYASERLSARDRAHDRAPVLGIEPSLLPIGVGVAVVMVASVPFMASNFYFVLPHVVLHHVIEREGPVFDGIWPATLAAGQKIIDAHRDAAGKPPLLWSTHAGLLEARNGIVHPSVDYIMHVLGPDARAAYVGDFRRLHPALVQTMGPLYKNYEQWEEQTSWDFFSAVLHDYDIVGTTPWSYLWARRDSSTAPWERVWSADIPRGATQVALPPVPPAAQTAGFPYVVYEVELDYRTRNAMHVLPIVGAIPRYLVAASDAVQFDAVSLDPYVTQSRFPLIVKAGARPSLKWAARSLLPGAAIDVSAIRLFAVRVSPTNARWLDDWVGHPTP